MAKKFNNAINKALDDYEKNNTYVEEVTSVEKWYSVNHKGTLYTVHWVHRESMDEAQIFDSEGNPLDYADLEDRKTMAEVMKAVHAYDNDVDAPALHQEILKMNVVDEGEPS